MLYMRFLHDSKSKLDEKECRPDFQRYALWSGLYEMLITVLTKRIMPVLIILSNVPN